MLAYVVGPVCIYYEITFRKKSGELSLFILECCQVSARTPTLVQHEVHVLTRPAVQVEQAPQLTVRQADRVTLTCAVLAGSPEPRLVWRRRKTRQNVVVGSSGWNDLLGEGRRLVMDAVERSDEGVYTCEADNGFGVTSSSSVNLTVLCKCSN